MDRIVVAPEDVLAGCDRDLQVRVVRSGRRSGSTRRSRGGSGGESGPQRARTRDRDCDRGANEHAPTQAGIRNHWNSFPALPTGLAVGLARAFPPGLRPEHRPIRPRRAQGAALVPPPGRLAACRLGRKPNRTTVRDLPLLTVGSVTFVTYMSSRYVDWRRHGKAALAALSACLSALRRRSSDASRYTEKERA